MVTTEEKLEDIKKFANDSPCICFNVRKAARAVTQVYDSMFKEIGMTATQGIILNSVRILGPMTVNEMAEAVATDRTTLTRNLKPLERDGFLTVHPGQDKREREINITKKGLSRCEKMIPIFMKFQQKLHTVIGESRMEKLCGELNTVIDEIKKF